MFIPRFIFLGLFLGSFLIVQVSTVGYYPNSYSGVSPLLTSTVHYPGMGYSSTYQHRQFGSHLRYSAPQGSRYGNGFSGNGGIGIRQTGETLANIYGQPSPIATYQTSPLGGALGYSTYSAAAALPIPGSFGLSYSGYGGLGGSYGPAHMPYLGK